MTLRSEKSCSDCGQPVDRRTFLQRTGAAAIAGVAIPSFLGGMPLRAAPTASSSAESAVGKLYSSLSDAQKKEIVFPFDHELRTKISANWHITKPKVQDAFFTSDQQKLIDEIVSSVTSKEGHEKLMHQIQDDAGTIGDFSVALFGTPGNGKFEFELTGRHLTLRADGNSVDKAAFGGPIIYGHGEEDPKKNVYHYQTKQVNEVFKALDAKQAEKALVAKAPSEAAVKIQGSNGNFPGIAVSDLSADQKKLVEATLKVLFAPYRQEDIDEVFEIVKASGGIDKLHFAFYQQEDLGNDKEWDIWRVEGPAFVWHFRGAPHVHAYINIGQVG
jgi:hypothetical protein